MFKEKERKRKDNVHVTEARAGVCNLAVEDEEKGENRDSIYPTISGGGLKTKSAN